MSRTGVILIVVAVGIAVLGTAQLPLVVWLSGDPTLNPVGNGILMWLSWLVAAVLLAIGAALAFLGRAGGPRNPAGAS
jgi:hypothetical protein